MSTQQNPSLDDLKVRFKSTRMAGDYSRIAR
jgi:hypothetical protein